MRELQIHSRGRRLFVAAAFVMVLVCSAQTLRALDVPQLKGRVNDYAGMLSRPAVDRLESMLADFERREGTQIVVLTIPSLEGDSLEEFTIRTAQQWGLGERKKDNGALLLIAQGDRKLRIEVGYGLEGRLTDLAAGRIIRNIITPQFKAGRFDQGVLEGVQAMIATAQGEFAAEQPPPQPAERRGGSPGLFGLLALLFLMRVVGRVSRPMGALTGAVLAPLAGLLFFGLGALMLLLLIPLGAAAGWLLSLFGSPLTTSHASSRRGYWGGGFGGGGLGGFGGGGGFSGGGGGFGGGGSSGSW